MRINPWEPLIPNQDKGVVKVFAKPILFGIVTSYYRCSGVNVRNFRPVLVVLCNLTFIDKFEEQYLLSPKRNTALS